MIANQLKTVILLGLMTALLLWIGNFFGPQGLTFAIIFVLIMNVGSYWFSDKIVLKMYRAKEVKDGDLWKIVKEVSQLANLPMPKVYIIPNQSLNAFATGRSPKHAAVAATEGIINHLSKDELKGVMAHEMGHVKNRDILISTIAATIAGVIGYVAMMARWAAIFGGFGGRDQDNGNNLVQLLVLAVVMPLIATIIRLAISRSREYLADETGAKIIHNPMALASALEKLEAGAKHSPMKDATEATAHMFIVNPFSGKGFISLLSTHPSTESRVKRLKAMV
jgi:heat shock protein HtpX